MVVLRARPAQSHQVFDRVARQKKTLETAQASHKRNYRELNALRERRTNFGEQSYRQAKNTGDTDGAVEFKSLPPVIETTPAPVFQPKTNLVPLPKANREGQNDDNQEGRTRTADATNGHSAANMPRLPILRATTASSSSILSLKNLANVIEDDRQYHRQYNADHPTAHGSASTSVNVQNAAVDTVER